MQLNQDNTQRRPVNDVELIALGAEWDALMAKYWPALALHIKLGDESHEIAERRAGVNGVEELTSEQAERLYRELGRAEVETGWRSVIPEFDRMDLAVDRLAEKIKSSAANTPLGLSIKERVDTEYRLTMGEEISNSTH